MGNVDLELAESSYKAWQWLLNANAEYKIIFGLSELEPVLTGTTVYSVVYTRDEEGNQTEIEIARYGGTIEENSAIGNELFDYFINNNSEYIVVEETNDNYSLRRITYPNDGVVRAENAKYFPGVQYQRKMPGDNHQQLKNSPRTKEVFEDLFNEPEDEQPYPFGDYFLLEPN